VDEVLPDRRLIDPVPLRSLLFVPGHREAWFAKAFSSGADAVIFDLSDAVPAANVPHARKAVGAAIEEHGGSQSFFVRVSPSQSAEIVDDLDAVVLPGLTGVMLPLVTSPGDVKSVAQRLDALESRRTLDVGTTIIFPLVETALAVRFAFEIATASGRVAYMGGATSRNGDIARAIGYRWTPEGTETLTLRSWVLLNMRAAAVPYPVSAMWSIVDDLDGLRSFALQTRALGYDGMMAIHPSHIPVINEVFTPTEEEVAHWRAVLEAMRSAQASGVGAKRHLGEMIDEADAKTATMMLEFAARLGIT
jgi:citrate lyase subunit beta/citryl-CoA lyase